MTHEIRMTMNAEAESKGQGRFSARPGLKFYGLSMTDLKSEIRTKYKSRFSVRLKALSAVLVAAFVAQDFAFAAGSPAAPAVPIDSEKGLVRRSVQTGGPMIINIQDAHTKLGAQESISAILEGLVKNYDLSLVAIEGAAGAVDTSLISSFPAAEAKKKAGEYLLKEGRISAAEFYSMVSGSSVKLYGAEDPALYEKNVDAFRNVVETRAAARVEIKKLADALAGLKSAVYSPELLEFSAKKLSRSGSQMQFTEYWDYAGALAAKKGVDVAAWPNLEKLSRTVGLEKQIDFSKAGAEREALIAELGRSLDKTALEALFVKALEYKKGKLGAAEFHRELRRTAGPLADDRFSSFLIYTDYLALYDSIDLMAVFDEAETFETALESRLIANEDEKALCGLVRAAGIVSRLTGTTLSAKDYAFYLANREECSVERLRRDVERFCDKRGVPHAVDFSILEKMLPEAETFYRVATERNAALLRNTLEKMKKENVRVAALVTGGFHTEGISTLMEQEKLSYLVVMPKFDEKTPNRPYVTVLTRKPKEYEEAFKDDDQFYLAIANSYTAPDAFAAVIAGGYASKDRLYMEGQQPIFENGGLSTAAQTMHLQRYAAAQRTLGLSDAQIASNQDQLRNWLYTTRIRRNRGQIELSFGDKNYWVTEEGGKLELKPIFGEGPATPAVIEVVRLAPKKERSEVSPTPQVINTRDLLKGQKILEGSLGKPVLRAPRFVSRWETQIEPRPEKNEVLVDTVRMIFDTFEFLAAGARLCGVFGWLIPLSAPVVESVHTALYPPKVREAHIDMSRSMSQRGSHGEGGGFMNYYNHPEHGQQWTFDHTRVVNSQGGNPFQFNRGSGDQLVVNFHNAFDQVVADSEKNGHYGNDMMRLAGHLRLSTSEGAQIVENTQPFAVGKGRFYLTERLKDGRLVHLTSEDGSSRKESQEMLGGANGDLENVRLFAGPEFYPQDQIGDYFSRLYGVPVGDNDSEKAAYLIYFLTTQGVWEKSLMKAFAMTMTPGIADRIPSESDVEQWSAIMREFLNEDWQRRLFEPDAQDLSEVIAAEKELFIEAAARNLGAKHNFWNGVPLEKRKTFMAKAFDSYTQSDPYRAGQEFLKIVDKDKSTFGLFAIFVTFPDEYLLIAKEQGIAVGHNVSEGIYNFGSASVFVKDNMLRTLSQPDDQVRVLRLRSEKNKITGVGGEIARVHAKFGVSVFSVLEDRELAAEEVEARWEDQKNNPYNEPLFANRVAGIEDPVEADARLLAGLAKYSRLRWKAGSGSFSRRTFERFAEEFKRIADHAEKIASGQASGRAAEDVVIVTFRETDAVGGMLEEMLRTAFPILRIKVINGNKQVHDVSRLQMDEYTMALVIDPPGSTFPLVRTVEDFRQAEARKNAPPVAPEFQSGDAKTDDVETPGSLRLLRELRERKIGSVFLMANRVETDAAAALGQEFRPDSPFTERIFTTNFTPAVDGSVAELSAHTFEAQNLFFHLLQAMRESYPRGTPFGMTLTRRDIGGMFNSLEHFQVEKVKYLTGMDFRPDGEAIPQESSREFQSITALGDRMSEYFLEPARVRVASSVHLWLSLFFGVSLQVVVLLILMGVGVSPMKSVLWSTVAPAFFGFLEAIRYQWFDYFAARYFRWKTGREQNHRIGNRAIVIGNPMWHMPISMILGQRWGLSKGFTDINIQQADQEVTFDYIADRLRRGTIVSLTVAWGRGLYSQRSQTAAIKIKKITGSFQSYGQGGPLVVGVGNLPDEEMGADGLNFKLYASTWDAESERPATEQTFDNPSAVATILHFGIDSPTTMIADGIIYSWRLPSRVAHFRSMGYDFGWPYAGNQNAAWMTTQGPMASPVGDPEVTPVGLQNGLTALLTQSGEGGVESVRFQPAGTVAGDGTAASGARLAQLEYPTVSLDNEGNLLVIFRGKRFGLLNPFDQPVEMIRLRHDAERQMFVSAELVAFVKGDELVLRAGMEGFRIAEFDGTSYGASADEIGLRFRNPAYLGRIRQAALETRGFQRSALTSTGTAARPTFSPAATPLRVVAAGEEGDQGKIVAGPWSTVRRATAVFLAMLAIASLTAGTSTSASSIDVASAGAGTAVEQASLLSSGNLWPLLGIGVIVALLFFGKKNTPGTPTSASKSSTLRQLLYRIAAVVLTFGGLALMLYVRWVVVNRAVQGGEPAVETAAPILETQEVAGPSYAYWGVTAVLISTTLFVLYRYVPWKKIGRALKKAAAPVAPKAKPATSSSIWTMPLLLSYVGWFLQDHWKPLAASAVIGAVWFFAGPWIAAGAVAAGVIVYFRQAVWFGLSTAGMSASRVFGKWDGLATWKKAVLTLTVSALAAGLLIAVKGSAPRNEAASSAQIQNTVAPNAPDRVGQTQIDELRGKLEGIRMRFMDLRAAKPLSVEARQALVTEKGTILVDIRTFQGLVQTAQLNTVKPAILTALSEIREESDRLAEDVKSTDVPAVTAVSEILEEPAESVAPEASRENIFNSHWTAIVNWMSVTRSAIIAFALGVLTWFGFRKEGGTFRKTVTAVSAITAVTIGAAVVWVAGSWVPMAAAFGILGVLVIVGSFKKYPRAAVLVSLAVAITWATFLYGPALQKKWDEMRTRPVIENVQPEATLAPASTPAPEITPSIPNPKATPAPDATIEQSLNRQLEELGTEWQKLEKDKKMKKAEKERKREQLRQQLENLKKQLESASVGETATALLSVEPSRLLVSNDAAGMPVKVAKSPERLRLEQRFAEMERMMGKPAKTPTIAELKEKAAALERMMAPKVPSLTELKAKAAALDKKMNGVKTVKIEKKTVVKVSTAPKASSRATAIWTIQTMGWVQGPFGPLRELLSGDGALEAPRDGVLGPNTWKMAKAWNKRFAGDDGKLINVEYLIANPKALDRFVEKNLTPRQIRKMQELWEKDKDQLPGNKKGKVTPYGKNRYLASADAEMIPDTDPIADGPDGAEDQMDALALNEQAEEATVPVIGGVGGHNGGAGGSGGGSGSEAGQPRMYYASAGLPLPVSLPLLFIGFLFMTFPSLGKKASALWDDVLAWRPFVAAAPVRPGQLDASVVPQTPFVGTASLTPDGQSLRLFLDPTRYLTVGGGAPLPVGIVIPVQAEDAYEAQTGFGAFDVRLDRAAGTVELQALDGQAFVGADGDDASATQKGIFRANFIGANSLGLTDRTETQPLVTGALNYENEAPRTTMTLSLSSPFGLETSPGVVLQQTIAIPVFAETNFGTNIRRDADLVSGTLTVSLSDTAGSAAGKALPYRFVYLRPAESGEVRAYWEFVREGNDPSNYPAPRVAVVNEEEVVITGGSLQRAVTLPLTTDMQKAFGFADESRAILTALDSEADATASGLAALTEAARKELSFNRPLTAEILAELRGKTSRPNLRARLETLALDQAVFFGTPSPVFVVPVESLGARLATAPAASFEYSMSSAKSSTLSAQVSAPVSASSASGVPSGERLVVGVVIPAGQDARLFRGAFRQAVAREVGPAVSRLDFVYSGKKDPSAAVADLREQGASLVFDGVTDGSSLDGEAALRLLQEIAGLDRQAFELLNPYLVRLTRDNVGRLSADEIARVLAAVEAYFPEPAPRRTIVTALGRILAPEVVTITNEASASAATAETLAQSLDLALADAVLAETPAQKTEALTVVDEARNALASFISRAGQFETAVDMQARAQAFAEAVQNQSTVRLALSDPGFKTDFSSVRAAAGRAQKTVIVHLDVLLKDGVGPIELRMRHLDRQAKGLFNYALLVTDASIADLDALAVQYPEAALLFGTNVIFAPGAQTVSDVYASRGTANVSPEFAIMTARPDTLKQGDAVEGADKALLISLAEEAETTIHLMESTALLLLGASLLPYVSLQADGSYVLRLPKPAPADYLAALRRKRALEISA